MGSFQLDYSKGNKTVLINDVLEHIFGNSVNEYQINFPRSNRGICKPFSINGNLYEYFLIGKAYPYIPTYIDYRSLDNPNKALNFAEKYLPLVNYIKEVRQFLTIIANSVPNTREFAMSLPKQLGGTGQLVRYLDDPRMKNILYHLLLN